MKILKVQFTQKLKVEGEDPMVKNGNLILTETDFIEFRKNKGVTIISADEFIRREVKQAEENNPND